MCFLLIRKSQGYLLKVVTDIRSHASLLRKRVYYVLNCLIVLLSKPKDLTPVKSIIHASLASQVLIELIGWFNFNNASTRRTISLQATQNCALCQRLKILFGVKINTLYLDICRNHCIYLRGFSCFIDWRCRWSCLLSS